MAQRIILLFNFVLFLFFLSIYVSIYHLMVPSIICLSFYVVILSIICLSCFLSNSFGDSNPFSFILCSYSIHLFIYLSCYFVIQLIFHFMWLFYLSIYLLLVLFACLWQLTAVRGLQCREQTSRGRCGV